MQLGNFTSASYQTSTRSVVLLTVRAPLVTFLSSPYPCPFPSCIAAPRITSIHRSTDRSQPNPSEPIAPLEADRTNKLNPTQAEVLLALPHHLTRTPAARLPRVHTHLPAAGALARSQPQPTLSAPCASVEYSPHQLPACCPREGNEYSTPSPGARFPSISLRYCI